MIRVKLKYSNNIPIVGKIYYYGEKDNPMGELYICSYDGVTCSAELLHYDADILKEPYQKSVSWKANAVNAVKVAMNSSWWTLKED